MYAWGFPLLMASLALIIDLAPGIDNCSVIKPAFGRYRCSFQSKWNQTNGGQRYCLKKSETGRNTFTAIPVARPLFISEKKTKVVLLLHGYLLNDGSYADGSEIIT